MGGKEEVSYLYDDYLVHHKSNVKKGYEWIQENLPELLAGSFDYEWQIVFSHDESKYKSDEYEAYDAYFYGGNRSYAVVQNFRKAWLLHIHRNSHHWQHWVLINDEPKEGEIILEMPYNYIIEMICDWWAFSWSKGNLTEIFDWYSEHSKYMKLARNTRQKIENILKQIQDKLEADNSELAHHGVKGMKWGVRNGPPYPLDKSKKRDTIVEDAIKSGKVSRKMNREKQMRHTYSYHLPGRSYLDGELDFAQAIIDEYSGNGKAIIDKRGNWTHKEKFDSSYIIGTHVDTDGTETRTNKGIIAYSKTGTHVYPRKEKR